MKKDKILGSLEGDSPQDFLSPQNPRLKKYNLTSYIEGYKQKWPKLHKDTNGKNLYVSMGSQHIGAFAT